MRRSWFVLMFVFTFFTSYFLGYPITHAMDSTEQSTIPIVKVEVTNTDSNQNRVPVSNVGFALRGDYLVEGSSLLLDDRDETGLIHYDVVLQNNQLVLKKRGQELTSINGTIRLVPADDQIDVHLVDVTRMLKGNMINVNPFRGSMEFQIGDRGNSSSIIMINQLNVEEYLKGVVPIEMPAASELESLKAQAVAARTYVMKRINQTIDDTTKYQAYRGYGIETARTNRAVDETIGQIMTYNGQPIDAFYSASNGGFTEAAEDVWSSSYPFFFAKEDPYDRKYGELYDPSHSYYNWSSYLSSGELEARIKAKGIDVGSLQGIQVVGSSTSGRITELAFNGTNGTFFANKQTTQPRSFLSLKSGIFTIKSESAPIYVISANQTNHLDKSSIYVRNKSGVQKKMDESMPYVLGTESVRALSSNGYTFTGNGYGHGVGMSQIGAMQMGKDGKSHLDILNFYYQGVKIEETYK